MSLLVCCARAESKLWLPTDGSASTLLLISDEAGAPFESYAYDTSRGTAVSLPIEADEDRTIFANRYSEPLHQIGLVDGQIGLGVTGIEIPESSLSILASTVRDGEPEPWASIDSLPSAYRDVRLLGTSPCVNLTQRDVGLPGTGDSISVAVVTGPEELLVGSGKGQFFKFDASGFVSLTRSATNTPHRAAFYDPVDKEVWLANNFGRVAHGDVERGLVNAPPLTTASRKIDQLVGGRGPGGLEIYARTSSLGVARLDGDHWTEILPPAATLSDRSRPKLLWIGPGHVLVMGLEDEALLEIEGDRVTRVPIALDFTFATPDALFTLADAPTLGGPMVGTRYGVIFVRLPEGWTRLPDPPVDGKIYVAQVFGRGLIFGGEGGVLTEFFEGYGYCEPFAVFHYNSSDLLPFGDGLVSIQGDLSTDRPGITVLQRAGGSNGR